MRSIICITLILTGNSDNVHYNTSILQREIDSYIRGNWEWNIYFPNCQDDNTITIAICVMIDCGWVSFKEFIRMEQYVTRQSYHVTFRCGISWAYNFDKFIHEMIEKYNGNNKSNNLSCDITLYNQCMDLSMGEWLLWWYNMSVVAQKDRNGPIQNDLASDSWGYGLYSM